jgi:FKBP-type peptidyl-prolyl cis-trans isomerase
MRRRALLALLVMTFVGCTLKDDSSTSSANAAPPPEAGRVITAPPDVAAIPADAQVTPSGLAFKILKPGTGSIHPSSLSTVTVHYTGWTTDGKMFDSSVARNEPATFGLGQVISGWTEGLQLMALGEKRRFWIPGQLAYDVPGARPDAPKGMLVFDIELLDIK